MSINETKLGNGNNTILKIAVQKSGRLYEGSMHGGNIVVSEVGKYKSEIAYHGDVLNTTARMLSKCHELNADFIISDFIVERVDIPKYLKVDSLGSFQLKGKQQEVGLYSVHLSLKKSEEVRKQRRKNLFRKKTVLTQQN